MTRSANDRMNVRDAAEAIACRVSSGAASEQDVLAKWSLLADLPREVGQALVDAGHVRTCARREMVGRQDSAVPGLGWLLRGLLRFWTTDVDGNEHTLDTAWSDSISMASLGGPRGVAPWNATAVAPSTLIVIPWNAVTDVRRSYPLDEVLLTRVGAEYRRRVSWQGLLRGVRLRRRLLMILRRMGDEFGRQIAEGLLLDFPVTHGDLAGLAHVTRDEVGRVMREFRVDGLIKPIGRRGLLIPDIERLGPPVELP